jgi:DNA-binding NarL/FixJ family response regulator
VHAAARGESVLSPRVASRLLAQVRTPAEDQLSDRELKVLALVARRATNREAAAELFISEATVKTHLLRIYAQGCRPARSAVSSSARSGPD